MTPTVPARVQTVADLSAADLGSIVRTNGYQGILTRIDIAADARYIELGISDPADHADSTRTWVALTTPASLVVAVSA